MQLDEAITLTGGLGRYQLFLASLLMVPASFPSAFVAFSQVFILAAPDHWCAPPPEVATAMAAGLLDPVLVRNWTVPLEWRDGRWRDSRCHTYAGVDYSALLETDMSSENRKLTSPNGSWPLQRCQHGWQYDHSDYEETLVTKFNLVCQDDWWPSLAISMFYLGSAFGTQSIGWASDRFGRRPTLTGLLVVTVILPTCSAFSPNFPVYVFFRFLIGATFPAIFQVPFIIVMEMTSAEHRTGMGMMANLIFGVAMSVLAGMAALIRHWFSLLLWTTVPFVSLLAYWWIVPESPRWLLAHDRAQEAENILQKMAKVNRKQVPANMVNSSLKTSTSDTAAEVPVTKEDKASTSVLALFRMPNLRRKTILSTLIFLSNSLVYTGLCYMSANLGVSDYLAFGISGLVEAPSCLLAWWAMEKYGRRWTTALTMMLVGLCCAANVFVPEESTWLNVVLPSLGKFGITGSFSILYVFGAELLPTVVRGKGLAVCCLLCSIGLMGSPYVIYLVVYSRVLPLLVMGILSFLGGAAAIFLPETTGTVLPQTLEDGELFGKDMRLLPEWCSRWRQRGSNTDLNASGENKEMTNIAVIVANGDTAPKKDVTSCQLTSFNSHCES